MKKTINLLGVILGLTSFYLNSQTLQNTLWKVYDPGNVFFGYYYSGADTIYQVSNNSIYSPFATYQESSNTFTINDIQGAGTCPATDTGRYTFFIVDDTLKFTKVNDPCSNRSFMLENYFFVNSITGINDANNINSIKVFPNPAFGNLVIQTDEKIKNIKCQNYIGQSIELKSENNSIDISALSEGMYFLNFTMQSGKTITKKILKQ